MNRRAFLTGVAATALTLPTSRSGEIVQFLKPASMGKSTDLVAYEAFMSDLLRKIAEAYAIPYELLTGEATRRA
jgi:hypothetical protein